MVKKAFSIFMILFFAAPVTSLTAAQKPSESPYEMTTYYLVLLYRGPNSTQQATPETERIQDAHMANIRQMADEGKLIMAGPMGDDSKLRGIFVLRAGSPQEAQQLAEADPAVKSGRLVPEVHPWYTAKNIRVFHTAKEGDAGSSSSHEERTPAEQEIRELESRRFRAMTDKDTAALEGILSDDLTYTHASAQFDNKAQLISAIRSGDLKYTSIVPGNVEVRVYGSAAVVTGQAAFKVENHGQPMAMDLRFTDMYVLQDGHWRMVAWESTRIPNP